MDMPSLQSPLLAVLFLFASRMRITGSSLYERLEGHRVVNSDTASNPLGHVAACSMLNAHAPFSVSREDLSCSVFDNNETVAIVEPDQAWDTYFDYTSGDQLIYESGGQNLTFGYSTSWTGLNAGTVQSVTVVGDSMWMLYSEQNYTGQRYLLKQGSFTEFYGFTGLVAQSIEKIGATCSARPIGLQNPLIVPDSAFSSPNAYGGTPSRARLYMAEQDGVNMAAALIESQHQSGGFNHLSANAWWGQTVRIVVELGTLHRLYAVSTQAVAWVSESGVSVYHTNTYKILFLAFGQLVEYEENGEVKVFQRETSDYREPYSISFQEPFVSEQVALEGIESYYSGLRMEFYGCEVGSGKTVSYIHSAGTWCSGTELGQTSSLARAQYMCSLDENCGYVMVNNWVETFSLMERSCSPSPDAHADLFQKVDTYDDTAASDVSGDLDQLYYDQSVTGVTVHADKATIRQSVPGGVASTSILVSISYENGCDITTYVYVHRSNHLTAREGLFDACAPESMSGTVYSSEVVYRCTCSYGLCEYVFTRFQYSPDAGTNHCFTLTGVRFDSAEPNLG